MLQEPASVQALVEDLMSIYYLYYQDQRWRNDSVLQDQLTRLQEENIRLTEENCMIKEEASHEPLSWRKREAQDLKQTERRTLNDSPGPSTWLPSEPQLAPDSGRSKSQMVSNDKDSA